MTTTRYIPQNSQTVTRDQLPSIVYTYENNNRICAIAYTGKHWSDGY